MARDFLRYHCGDQSLEHGSGFGDPDAWISLGHLGEERMRRDEPRVVILLAAERRRLTRGPRRAWPPGLDVDPGGGVDQVQGRDAFGRVTGTPGFAGGQSKPGAPADRGQRRCQVERPARLEARPDLRLHLYAFSGSWRVKVLPRPKVDSTVRSPSCMRAISRESQRPRPLPDTRSVDLVSIRTNRVNRRAWSSSAIPIPSSVTATLARPLPLTRTLMRAPAGEYLAALLRRFLTTIWKRSGSTSAWTARAGLSMLSSCLLSSSLTPSIARSVSSTRSAGGFLVGRPAPPRAAAPPPRSPTPLP